jgi:hypothetical protein
MFALMTVANWIDREVTRSFQAREKAHAGPNPVEAEVKPQNLL